MFLVTSSFLFFFYCFFLYHLCVSCHFKFSLFPRATFRFFSFLMKQKLIYEKTVKERLPKLKIIKFGQSTLPTHPAPSLLTVPSLGQCSWMQLDACGCNWIPVAPRHSADLGPTECLVDGPDNSRKIHEMSTLGSKAIHQKFQ